MGWRVLAVMAGERFRGDGVVVGERCEDLESMLVQATPPVFFVSAKAGSTKDVLGGGGTYRGQEIHCTRSEEGRAGGCTGIL